MLQARTDLSDIQMMFDVFY